MSSDERFSISNLPSFDDLSLIPPLLKALSDVGYETPSPIQAQTIPHLLAGKDVLGQAQTGTGKTAAFALPLLSRIDITKSYPQTLVLTPTRELAIQVAEAFQRYAAHMKGFHVLPIYGGQDYSGQLRQLKRGVHVVVGTPGRIMDHMRRGTLKLESLQSLVLDEADEMLRMGFIDDVSWILEQTPNTRQIALFSATMPPAIKQIADKYLHNPEEVTIKVKTATADTIRQRYWMVSGLHKLDALTRILEVEPFDGIIIFVRTKTITLELADKLQARGYSAAALNGDIAQNQRERTVESLKKGHYDILVATDVVARGLDVERISHVINYDIPYDTESYIHRIGRTGRAGRNGEAILFVAPREKRMLSAIERASRKKIELMELPSTQLINDKRINRFQQRITDTLATNDLSFYRQLMEQYQAEHNVPALDIAAALASLAQGDEPFLLKDKPLSRKQQHERHSNAFVDAKSAKSNRMTTSRTVEKMDSYRIEVGHAHKVKPGNIVGAIANEAGLESHHIGRIEIFDSYSIVDLPEGMPKEVFQALKKVWVAGQKLNITKGSAANNKSDKPAKSDDKSFRKPPKKAKKKNRSKARSNSDKGKRRKPKSTP